MFQTLDHDTTSISSRGGIKTKRDVHVRERISERRARSRFHARRVCADLCSLKRETETLNFVELAEPAKPNLTKILVLWNTHGPSSAGLNPDPGVVQCPEMRIGLTTVRCLLFKFKEGKTPPPRMSSELWLVPACACGPNLTLTLISGRRRPSVHQSIQITV